jgi:hypothetical protein
MWRSLFAASVIYASGHPAVEAYRPALLDRPLQGFYQDVNAAAREGHQVLTTLDDARCMRYLKTYIARMDAQLRSAN